MTKQNFSLNDKTKILEDLRASILEVDFLKTDGTLRTMKCTLRSDLIPKVEKRLIDTTKPERRVNEEVIPVYDLESSGWRSFRIGSIQSITVRK